MIGDASGNGSNGFRPVVPAGATAGTPAPEAAGHDTPRPMLEPAALWRRGLARLIDWLAMFWALFALQVIGITFWVKEYADRITPTGWGGTFMVVTTIAGLYALLELVYVAKRGQTPAKELLKIRVVHPERDGGALGWGVAFTRWLVPGLAMALPLYLSPVVLGALGLPALFDPQRRTIHDRLAGTAVVPYDAKEVEGPIKNRRALIRSGLDRQVAALAGKPELLEGDDDAPPSRRTGR
jgi:uncharacterized RDD family membrane protein YckC